MRLVIVPLILAVGTVAIAAASGPPTSATPQTPVAVELFTSQGCSSCPPADALIERLAREPNVIAITRPVTYWDNLGWKDTFAREANTNLQRAYAAKGNAGAGVYTPQVIVQGGDGIVGSDELNLRRMIIAAKRVLGPSISARAAADGGRVITVDGAGKGNATVSVVALHAENMVHIGRGENGGRNIKYTNVAIAEAAVGQWRGGHLEITVPAAMMKQAGADRYALIVQVPGAGPIIAARYI